MVRQRRKQWEDKLRKFVRLNHTNMNESASDAEMAVSQKRNHSAAGIVAGKMDLMKSQEL